MHELVLDIETTDWFTEDHIKVLPRREQIDALRFGVAVTCLDGEVWQEWQEGDLATLWQLAMQPDLVVVGYNSEEFDLPIIRRCAGRGNEWPASFDLMRKIVKATGRWYKLEALAQANLGRGKSADGQLAAAWLRSGDPELAAKAVAYCRDDVQITRELYELVKAGEPLFLPPQPERDRMEGIYLYLRANGGWRHEFVEVLAGG